jgi:hypothetical protein
MIRTMTTRARLLLVTLMACACAWLGCAALLDIDDGTFVPLVEAGGGDAAPANDAPGFKVVASRRTVRVPRGETRSFDAVVEGTSGKADLQMTSSLISVVEGGASDVTASMTSLGANRFRITLASSATVSAAVDAKLDLAVTVDGVSGVPAQVSVLVGLPGTADRSFGTEGTGSVTGPAISGLDPTGHVLAVVGRRVLIASADRSVYQFDEDGNKSTLFSLDFVSTGPPVTVHQIAADGVAIDVASDRDGEPFLTTALRAALDDGGGGGAVSGTSFAGRALFAITRHEDAGWYTVDDGPEKRSRLRRRDTDAAIDTPINQSSLIVPTLDGFLIVGTKGANRRLARIKNGALDTSFGKPDGGGGDAGGGAGDAGAVSVPIAGNTADGDDGAIIASSVSTSGFIVALTYETYASLPDEPALFANFFAPSGVFIGGLPLQGALTGDVVADAHDRFVFAIQGAPIADLFDRVALMRRPANGDDVSNAADIDRDIGQEVGMCLLRPLVGIDEDGMIIVLCPASPASILYRRWP